MPEYWFRQSDAAQPEGPCTAAQLRALAARGTITRTSLISADQQRWHVAATVGGLFDAAAQPTPPAAPGDVYGLAGDEAKPAEQVWPRPAAPTHRPGAPPTTRPVVQPGAFARGGTPGRDRDLNWFIVCSCIMLVLGVLVIGTIAVTTVQQVQASGYGRQSPQTTPVLAVCAQLANCATILVGLGMAIYWLVWIYQVHAEMRAYTGGMYPISPGKALGYSFIPFYNIYWCVYMPYELARSVQGCLRSCPQVVNPGTVLTYQILAIVPGSCVMGLGLLFYGLAMRSIQNGLNELWTQARRDTVAYAM